MKDCTVAETPRSPGIHCLFTSIVIEPLTLSWDIWILRIKTQISLFSCVVVSSFQWGKRKGDTWRFQVISLGEGSSLYLLHPSHWLGQRQRDQLSDTKQARTKPYKQENRKIYSICDFCMVQPSWQPWVSYPLKFYV